MTINLVSSVNWSLTKSQTFNPDWPEVGLIRAE